MKIGTLLVNEGFIREADVDTAMEIQQRESRSDALPLGKLLVKKNLIDRSQLQQLLQHPEIVREIESFAIESGRVDPRQLARCVENKPAGRPLGDALVTAGLLTADDLKVFFEKQLDSLKICELAVETGMVSETDINRVLHSQRSARTIGEILCDLNLITPLDLNSVLSKHRKHLRLGEILLKHGMIDKPTFDRALQAHEHRGEPLGSVLRRENILTETQLYKAFSRQYNIPFETLEGFEYSAGQRKALTETVGKTLSEQFHILPLRLEESTLTVAVSDPANLDVVNSLRSKRVYLRIQCVLVTESTMERLYTDLYGARPPSSASKPTASPSPADTSPPAPRRSEAPPSASDASGALQRPVDRDVEETGMSPEQWVHSILNHSLLTGARAIHIDQGLRRTTLTFRVGDVLREPSETWPEEAFQDMARQVMDAFKEIAGMDPNDRRRPQEGMFRAGMADRGADRADMDFSVTSCPTLAGENMTIQHITPCAPAPDLDALPHSPHVVSSLKQIMKTPTGMLLVAAPPGSGRATTLYGMLRHVHQPGQKAVTVEDTVSFSMPEAVQLQGSPSTGHTCETMLKAALRLDPDVLLAGDLTGPENAVLGIEAARKGILLLGGVSAADAAAAVSQLGALDRPGQTASLLKAVLAQRYVRSICPECKQPYQPSPEEWRPLFERLPDGLVFHRGAGCPACGFSGYRGRVLLSELLPMSDAVSRAMKQRLSERDIRHLVIRSGIKTLVDDGLSKLDRTTLSEIIDAAPPEATEAFKCIRADARPATPAAKPTPRKEASFEIIFSSREIPGADLRRLHHAYEVLMEEAGRRSRPSRLALFETFIKTHYSAICRRYDCNRVAFSVARQEGKVLLLATPVVR